MSNKSILLLFIFVIATTSLGYLKFFYLKDDPNQSFSKTSLRTESSNTPSATSLFFSPNPLVLTSNERSTIWVALNSTLPPENKPTIIQLEIGYNPLFLNLIDIIPGDYFVNPEIILYNIDAKNGRISYALKGDPNPTASIAATINLNSFYYGRESETQLIFLPKTSAKNEDGVIDLKSMDETKIILKPSFSIPQASQASQVIQ